MATEKTKTRRCPFCREEVKADAIRCMYCRSDLVPERPTHGGVCPFCKEAIDPDAVKCRHCGSWVGPIALDERCDCGTSAEPAVAARRATVTVGPGRGLGPSCETRWMACKVSCVVKYGGIGIGARDDPEMLRACEESCDASYRMCSGVIGIY